MVNEHVSEGEQMTVALPTELQGQIGAGRRKCKAETELNCERDKKTS